VTEVGGSITDVRVVAAQDTQTLASLIAEQAVDLHAALVFVHDAGVGVRNLLIAMELKGALGRCNVVGFTPRVARRHSLSLDRVVDRMWKRACAERHPYGGCSR